jgi:hypothetical protein
LQEPGGAEQHQEPAEDVQSDLHLIAGRAAPRIQTEHDTDVIIENRRILEFT